MRTIRVDDEVWRELQRRAEPLVDQPNDVIRRLLRLDEAAGVPSVPHKVQAGPPTPQKIYRPLISTALRQAGGAAPTSTVLEFIEARMNGKFSSGDFGHTPGGALIWRNRAMWERKKMILDGLLKDDSPRGIWDLTDAGRREDESP